MKGTAAGIAAAVAAIVASTVCRADSGRSLEYGIKAAYLAKFAPFVEWPQAAFSSPDSPISICVSGADPFGGALDQIVAGQRVAGRALAVRHIGPLAADSSCQIAFIGGSAEQPVADGAALARARPILTVTDGADSGGIVCFVIVDNRVRFTVDKKAADEAHIVVSSKLLGLAVETRQ